MAGWPRSSVAPGEEAQVSYSLLDEHDHLVGDVTTLGPIAVELRVICCSESAAVLRGGGNIDPPHVTGLLPTTFSVAVLGVVGSQYTLKATVSGLPHMPGGKLQSADLPWMVGWCPPGEVALAPDNTTCVPCAAGEVESERQCERCPPGSVTTTPGQTICLPCVGQQAAEESQSACETCTGRSVRPRTT